MFQLRACDFCDDIFGETADICFGDAWLPSFDREWRGTNIVLSRNAFLDGFLTAGVERNDLWLDDLSVDDLINSQAGSFRHRWFGMSVRLPEAGKHGEPVPLKRKRILLAPGFLLSPSGRALTAANVSAKPQALSGSKKSWRLWYFRSRDECEFSKAEHFS